ncbi:hypothetical protein N665_0518s0016 [Sinapis alba]|nr:hypothetical protein N665_0518s0016 [Sinapis alba]
MQQQRSHETDSNMVKETNLLTTIHFCLILNFFLCDCHQATNLDRERSSEPKTTSIACCGIFLVAKVTQNFIYLQFSHPKERDGAEPMRLSHDHLQGQTQTENTEWQRREAQENVQEQRRRDITESKRYFEMGRRNAQEIVQQHRQRLRETSVRQRNLEEEKCEAQENAQEQRLMATPLDGRFNERKHGTESSSMVAKRAELLTSLQSMFKDVIDDIAAGYKRMGIEHGEGCQRVEAKEEIVQEQSNRQDSRRQAQENLEILERVWRNEELGGK